MIFAAGFLAGALVILIAQFAYVRRQAVHERASLVCLRDEDDRAEMPGALILEVLRHSKGR